MRQAIGPILFAAAVLASVSSAQGADAPHCRLQSDCGLTSESAAAAEIIRTYYAALAARDYRTAYAQWAEGGAASGKSYANFAAGFMQTRSTAARILQVGEPDGAAGSMFITVAVRVDATSTNGRQQHFAGSYTLRRVNDVPGASADQLRWHIASASLHPVQP